MIFPRWLWIPTLAQTLLSLVLCFVPLFDLLAYEYCFAVGCMAAVTSTIIGFGAADAADRPLQAIRNSAVLAFCHLLPGVILISLNATRVRNCNFFDGIAFFLLLPGCTALYGALLGVLAARLTLGMAQAIRVMFAWTVVLAPLAMSLWALYKQPPIFVFDHLWGYFAGSLYDETITIDKRLLMFRLGTAVRALAVMAIVVAWERWARLGTSVVMSILFAALGTTYAYEIFVGPQFGFRVTRDDILEHLPVQVEREGVVLHLPTGTDAAMQKAMADDHAFRLQQLLAHLDVTLAQPIHSYVYANAADKALYMGGRSTMITKPWLNEIHVHDVRAPHYVMPHELAHAVAANFGSALLRVSAQHELLVNMGLVEGFAQAFTPDTDELDLHHWARAMFDLHLAPDMRTMLGSGDFWAQAPRRAYTVAGSFVRYLFDKYGAPPLKLAYPRADFEQAYGKSLDALVTEWEGFLKHVDITPREKHIAAERFRTPSIFVRTCAHEIAQLNSEAERAEPQKAVALRRQICEHLSNAPAARLELAEALRRAGDLDGFLTQAKELLDSRELNAVQQAEVHEARSDVLWEQGRLDEAHTEAKAVLDLNISIAAERRAWARIWAMDLKPEVSDPVMRFLQGKLPVVSAVLLLDKEASANPGDKTFPYLIARQLHQAEAWEQAAAYLRDAGPHPFPPFEAERERLLGDVLWRLGKLDAAQQAFATYEQHGMTSGDVAIARDWQTRLAWQKRVSTHPS